MVRDGLPSAWKLVPQPMGDVGETEGGGAPASDGKVTERDLKEHGPSGQMAACPGRTPASYAIPSECSCQDRPRL